MSHANPYNMHIGPIDIRAPPKNENTRLNIQKMAHAAIKRLSDRLFAAASHPHDVHIATLLAISALHFGHLAVLPNMALLQGRKIVFSAFCFLFPVVPRLQFYVGIVLFARVLAVPG